MIRLTIQLADDVLVIMNAGYTHIRLYRAVEEAGSYTHLAFLSLNLNQTVYYYDDITGTTDNWYVSCYYNSTTQTDGEWSDPAQGIAPSLFHGITYPVEVDFDVDQSIIIRKIRRYIGDFPNLSRMYLEDCATNSCDFIHNDGKTIELEHKGWPVLISLSTFTETATKNSLIDPTVQGYKYLTFSGTLMSGTNCSYDTIDIWSYSFKFSDREVYEAYGDAMIPARVPSDRVTSDHLVLQAAISLLENMTSDDMVDDGAVINDDASKYDPSPGLTERDKTIKRLKKMLDDLVDEVIKNQIIDLSGVLID